MHEQRTTRLLHACGDEAVSDPHAGWQAIRGRLPHAQARRARPLRPLRLSLGTALLAAVLVCSTAAALGAGLLDGLIARHPELRRLQGEQRFHPLELRQEQNGYTVTIRGAAADPATERLYVIYSITPPVGGIPGTPTSMSPDGPDLQLHAYTLTTADRGTLRPMLGGLGDDSGAVLTFIAPDLGGAATPLSVHLTMDFALFEFRPSVEAPATPLPGQPLSRPHYTPIGQLFEFDFTVPLTAP